MASDSTANLKKLLSEWGLLYGRRIEPEAMDVWIRLFSSTPPKLLDTALARVTQTSERMPTPGTLQKAIDVIRSESISTTTARIIGDGEDRNGIPCVFWSDEPTMPAYKANDCPEGRAFLALLGEMRQKKAMR